ncbi:MAG: DUF3089 domain-containing protein [Actinomycetia bacterium]|nr:DUF3089 domain-containing protein [Actinomycetes bacterium]
MNRTLLRAIGSLLAALALIGAACSNDSNDSSSSSTTAATSDADSTDTAEQSDEESGESDSSTDTAFTEPAVSATYSDLSVWLCHPDKDGDSCDIDLDSTLIAPDGTQSVEPFEPATDPPIDCIYYYPTISTDPGANSDLDPGESEIGITQNQAARFAEVCNVYAPVYRQTPLTAMFSGIEARESGTATTLPADDPANPRNIAYGDVRDSFMHYLATKNEGRPFVLMGHSQGAGHLNRLISEEIDGNDELRDQMLSALLIGSSVTVDGGDNDSFENVAGCSSPNETNCVISYATFYEAEPPPDNSFFGRPRDGGGRALCNNPAALSGGAANLSSYFEAGHAPDSPAVGTPWVHYTELLEGECVSNEDFDWLQVTPSTAPGLPQELGGRLTPEWGTHLADVNFTIGDLIEVVRTQSGQA